MDVIWNNMLFGISLTVLAFELGSFLHKKTGLTLMNPLLLSIAFCTLFLNVLKIEYSAYMKGGSVLTMLILPSTASVGLSLYRQFKVLKKQLLPIFFGSLASCIVTVLTVPLIGKALDLDNQTIASIIPKSVTMAIALDVSDKLGGIKAIAMVSVVMTGIVGSMLSSVIVKALKLKDPVALGVAFGSTSHAAGTAKAMEYGELEGAISGICIGMAGIFTSLIVLFM